MSQVVYVTGMGPSSGKSLVTLGVVELLSHRVGRVGFFRPVVASLPDNDTELIRARFGLSSDRCGHAFVAPDLRALTAEAEVDLEGGVERVLAAYRAIAISCDVVVVEGTDFSGASSPVEFAINASLARHLGAAVIAVVDGSARSSDEIVESVRVSASSLAERGDAVLAVIANRVPVRVQAEVAAALARGTAGAPPAFAIPGVEGLQLPNLAELGAALRATVVAGESDELAREVRHVKVAAMSIPNLLDHIADGTVLLVPGDRPDVLVAAALSRHSSAVDSVAGLVLTGGLLPDPRVAALIRGVADTGRPLPMLAVATDTYETAHAASLVESPIAPGNGRKIELALGAFEANVDLELLAERIQVTRSEVVTPLMFQHDIIERAQRLRRRIVLPEGTDDRILTAADRLLRRQVCELVLLGDEAVVRQRASELGLDVTAAAIIDPATSPWLQEFAATYHELRRHRGVTPAYARDQVTDVSYFGTLMVHSGRADGMVSGAAHTTAHTIRPALEIIRTKPGAPLVSSAFFMLLEDRVLVYADCAINTDPNAEQLAIIAEQSATTARLFGIEPLVAMLSYSTGTSGTGSDVDKVRRATELVRERCPDLLVEGPIQYDAAIDADVARTKLPGSPVAGRANVFVFPDLNTGNNTYKAVQRSAQAIAVGPALQGLAKPVNDLSRGATVADIVNTVAITAIQAQEIS